MNAKENGVTLIALVVTMIILMILAGVSFRTIGNSEILEKATEASTKTIEQAMFEKVKMIYTDCEIGYYHEFGENHDLEKENYVKEKFEEKLQNEEKFANVDYKNGVVSLEYCGEDYRFTVAESVELKENVQIGEYVYYPFAYSDIYTKQEFSNQNGWRVLDDGSISGNVKLISTGIPMKWSYDGTDAATAIQTLNNNFLTTSFKTAVSKVNIIGSELNSKYAKSISSITLRELNAVHNAIAGTERTENDTSTINPAADLLYYDSPEAYYWVLTAQAEKRVYYVLEGEFGSFRKMKLGIRPVIELKDGLKGIKENEYWKIVD